MINLKPMPGKIVVLVDDFCETSNHIIIPETHVKRIVKTGEVLAVGDNMKDDIQVGDKILFPPMAGEEIKLKGEYEKRDVRVLKTFPKGEDAVLAKITEK